MDIAEDSAKVGFPPPFVYLGFLLLGLAADRLFALPVLPVLPIIRYDLGAGFGIFGLFLAVGASNLFKAIGTDVKPWRPTSGIVTAGVFSWSRNPMYLGMAVLYLAIAFALGSIGALALFPVVIVVIRTQVIAREERYLEAKFGEEYLSYKQRVRRWI